MIILRVCLKNVTMHTLFCEWALLDSIYLSYLHNQKNSFGFLVRIHDELDVPERVRTTL